MTITTNFGRRCLVLMPFLAVATPLAAQEAHEHGRAALKAAVTANELLVEFSSPLANIVGFEHAPADDADRQALATATAALMEPSQIVGLSTAAACTPNGTATLDAPEYMTAGHNADHEAHDEHHDEHEQHAAEQHHDDHDDHDEEHEQHADHDDHADEHEHHAGDHDEAHADVRVTYRFVCAKPESLVVLAFMGFERFPGIEHVDVEAVGERGFAAGELTRRQPRLSLKGL